MWDGQLGDFLRSRREALPPGAIGLKAGPRRRTPGLRRSEVAVRSGISVEYLTRLEQGHDTNPSVAVLAALADALLLDAVDRWHLHGLAAVARGFDLIAADADAEVERSPGDGVLRVLTHLDPAPACILDHQGDLITWNRSFRNFALPIGLLAASPPNLVAWVFCDANASDVIVDWDGFADDAAAWLYTLARGDPGVEALAAEFSHAAGEAFRRRWRAHPVGPRTTIPRTWRHPDVGDVTLHFEAFAITGTTRLHLVVLQPADDDAERAITRLEDHT